MKPLTVRQIEEIDNWMRVKFLKSIREAADGDQQMLATGMAEMLKLSFFTARGSKFLSSMSGIAKIISMTTDASYDKALSSLRKSADVVSFNDTFTLLNGYGEDTNTGDKVEGSDP